MLGIEPTHMDELRRKQGFRLFLEERILDLVEIAKALYRGLLLVSFLGKSLAKLTEKFILDNKRHTAAVLVAILVAIIMMW